MGSQMAVQDQSFSLIEVDPDIRVSVVYLYQDKLCGIEQFYKVNGDFQLDDFTKYLESTESIPKFKENQVSISSIQIGTKEYFQEESRNFRQLNVQDNQKIILKLQTLNINDQQKCQAWIDAPDILQNDESDLLINNGQIELQFQSFQIIENNSQNLIAKQNPIVQRQKILQQQNIEKPINNVWIQTQVQMNIKKIKTYQKLQNTKKNYFQIISKLIKFQQIRGQIIQNHRAIKVSQN